MDEEEKKKIAEERKKDNERKQKLIEDVLTKSIEVLSLKGLYKAEVLKTTALSSRMCRSSGEADRSSDTKATTPS